MFTEQQVSVTAQSATNVVSLSGELSRVHLVTVNMSDLRELLQTNYERLTGDEVPNISTNTPQAPSACQVPERGMGMVEELQECITKLDTQMNDCMVLIQAIQERL